VNGDAVHLARVLLQQQQPPRRVPKRQPLIESRSASIPARVVLSNRAFLRGGLEIFVGWQRDVGLERMLN
jgi:hypothetical protein